METTIWSLLLLSFTSYGDAAALVMYNVIGSLPKQKTED